MSESVRIVTRIEELAEMRGEWNALLARSAGSAPTLTPSWMLRWWEIFGGVGERTLQAVVVAQGPRMIGLAPLLSRPVRGAVGAPVRRIEFLASGEGEEEETCSDYIGLIAERGAEWRVAELVAGAIAARRLGPWDELSLAAMNGDSAVPGAIVAGLQAHCIAARLEVSGASHYVRLPASWDEYLAALPSTRRQFVRRTLRDYENWAGTSSLVERAGTAADLSRGIEILESLHRERWRQDGQEGVFASPRFRAFHVAVLPELFEANAVDLVWLQAHGRPIAAAYNLVCADGPQFYQSGRAMDLPRGVRPGIVLHAHCIRAAISAGHREYDFLPGDSRYKRTLGTHVRPVVHLRAFQPSLRGSARRALEFARGEVGALRRGVLGRGGAARAVPGLAGAQAGLSDE